jgi:hypothetical protein
MATLQIKEFDDEVHQAAKEAAVKRRQSLKDFVTEAVQEKLDRVAREAKP